MPTIFSESPRDERNVALKKNASPNCRLKKKLLTYILRRVSDTFTASIQHILYADYNRYHDRGFQCTLKKKASDIFREVFACSVQIHGARVTHGRFNALSDYQSRLIHQILVVAQKDESARDNIGRFVEFTRASIYRCNNNTESFLSKRFPVAHEDVGEL